MTIDELVLEAKRRRSINFPFKKYLENYLDILDGKNVCEWKKDKRYDWDAWETSCGNEVRHCPFCNKKIVEAE